MGEIQGNAELSDFDVKPNESVECVIICLVDYYLPKSRMIT